MPLLQEEVIDICNESFDSMLRKVKAQGDGQNQLFALEVLISSAALVYYASQGEDEGLQMLARCAAFAKDTHKDKDPHELN